MHRESQLKPQCNSNKTASIQQLYSIYCLNDKWKHFFGLDNFHQISKSAHEGNIVNEVDLIVSTSINLF